MNQYRVIITYFDSGTKKCHDVEFDVRSDTDEHALRDAKREFNRYEKNYKASWVRIVRAFKIILVEPEEA